MKKIKIVGKKLFSSVSVEVINERTFKKVNVFSVDLNISAAVTHIRTSAITTKKVIITGTRFNKLDKYSQLLVLYHELGHIKLNHKATNRRIMKQENEADLFACKILMTEYCLSKNYVINLFSRTLKHDNEFKHRLNYINISL